MSGGTYDVRWDSPALCSSPHSHPFPTLRLSSPALRPHATSLKASFNRLLVKRCQVPVIALGGISVGRVAEASKMGFEGVAILGAVWQASDPVKAFDELQNECERHRRDNPDKILF